MKIEPILLTTARVQTFLGDAHLTNATAFFFERGPRLFLVTSRHVVHDEATGHHPDRITIDLHLGEEELAAVTGFSIPLFRDGLSIWRTGSDAAGDVDVAMIEIDRRALPPNTLLRAFTPAHLAQDFEAIEVGSPLLVVGFPLGFHDSLHRLPIVRQAVIASSFGLRFQGQGYFLTDARTHRGTSGPPSSCAARPNPAPAPACPGCCSASIPRGSMSAPATRNSTKPSTSTAPGTPTSSWP